MYKIYCGDICIHDDRNVLNSVKVVNPKLTMSDSAAGSLTFTLPPVNVGYSAVQRLVSEIKVYRDGSELWSGRVIDEHEDFYKQRAITCEGELAYLNDTTQPPHEYHDITVRDFLAALISIHNAKAKADKQFAVGVVTVIDSNDSIYRYTNYETTLACINDKLVDRFGGHIRIRKLNGIRYIDYLADYPNLNSQVIQFGKNLLDFTKNWDLAELATVIVPRGAALDESPIEALQAYLGVEEVNEGSPYVASTEAVRTYGWIETVVTWDNVTEASNLLSKAQDYLADVQFEKMVLEVSAVDLHYLSADIEAIDLLDQIRCISSPHGMNRIFPVTKVEIPIDKPEETVYTFGSSERKTLTATTRGAAKDILDKIEKIPSKHEILEAAKDNATALLNSSTNGYVTILKGENGTTELIISNDPDWTRATKIWRWNMNGLGYSDETDENGIRRYKLAMTMDGSIVADFITSGVLNGDLIRAGKIRQAIVPQGKTENDISYWDLDNGVMNIVANSFKLTSGDTIESVAGNYADAAFDLATEYADGLDADLTQLEIFKRLTNNEANQGIYLEGTKLYINAQMLNAKLIKADDIYLEGIPLCGQQYKIELYHNQYNADSVESEYTVQKMNISTDEWEDVPCVFEPSINPWTRATIYITQFPYMTTVGGSIFLEKKVEFTDADCLMLRRILPINDGPRIMAQLFTTNHVLDAYMTDMLTGYSTVEIDGVRYRRIPPLGISADSTVSKSIVSDGNVLWPHILPTFSYLSSPVPLHQLLAGEYLEPDS